MKKFFFPRLALSGIKKNRKLYLPYLLSCIGTVMMYYILHSISRSLLLNSIHGGEDAGIIISLGKFVIAAFSLLFLFYTNSFLVRRRYREFGLYSILGMDKRGISRIMLWESLIVALIGLGGGLILGVLFSKLAELLLLNFVHADIDFTFRIEPEAIMYTLMIYAAIFLLLLIKSLIQVRRSKPIALLHSENVGEKPVRANWVFALLGLLILGAAYWISVSIESPLSAITLFFVAVIMVIVATYLLFVSGSVALCRLLQKNKKYYYNKKHFISVSSMKYRMKRNGAGLASICILCTMVLVMISDTTSLYFGSDDMINENFVTENYFQMDIPFDKFKPECCDAVKEEHAKIFKKHGVIPENVMEYNYISIAGRLENTVIDPYHGTEDLSLQYENVRQVYFIAQDEYNVLTGENVDLAEDEALLYESACRYDEKTLTLCDLTLDIKAKTENLFHFSELTNIVVPTFVLIVRNFDCVNSLNEIRYSDVGQNNDPNESMAQMHWYFGYDIDADEEEAVEILFEMREATFNNEYFNDNWSSTSTLVGNKYAKITSFFETFGGLLFLAVVLSVMFIFAAVTIIYYKQICEGYEDQSRFEIMKKVGMTDTDIKKSINSQVLTVFFAPLLFSALHLVFAFPMIWKILRLFGLSNQIYAISITAIAFAIFAVLYAVIYKLTARSYFKIVSSED